MLFAKQKSRISNLTDKITFLSNGKEVLLDGIETIKSDELTAWIKSGNVASLTIVGSPVESKSKAGRTDGVKLAYILVVEFNHVDVHKVMATFRGEPRKWSRLQTVVDYIASLGYDNTERDIHIILQQRKEI